MKFSAIIVAAIVGISISLAAPQADVPASLEMVEVSKKAAG